jgi:hypothetical protein
LRTWIGRHQPGTILVANVMGQFGVVAEKVLEEALGGPPWDLDPEREEPLAEALTAWTARAIKAFLLVLVESGSDLWLVHDRAVVFGEGPLTLSSWRNDWSKQVCSDGLPLEASDALAGLDIPSLLSEGGLELAEKERWFWPVAPGQRHLIEALVVRRGAEFPVATINPCPRCLPQGPY